MSESHQFSYWEKETFLNNYDLIVIGAGLVGLSSAIFYKRQNPGSTVLVLEKGFLPEGASTRNAGFACVGSITEYIADLGKEAEAEIRKRIKQRYEGLNLLKDTLGEDAIGYEACGGFELFTDEQTFEHAARYIPKFNEWMKEATGEGDVYSRDTLNGYDVISNRLEGALHPGKLMRSYIRLAMAEDIEIKWNSRVVQAEPDGSLTLNNGTVLTASKVLAAANGFVRNLMPDLKVEPARGYVMVTGELDKLPWRGTFHYDRGYIYFRNVGKRLLLGGARNIASEEETTDRFGINRKIKDHLIEFADEVLKLDSGWNIEEEWSGIMGFTETKSPVLRQLDRHRYVAAGLSGMGIAIGTKIGSMAAELVS